MRTIFLIAGLLATSCSMPVNNTDALLADATPNSQSILLADEPAAPKPSQQTWSPWLNSLMADGFDFPVGNVDGKGSYNDLKTNKQYNGWYIAAKTAENYELGVHTGEDWNGVGGSNTDLGQPVHATAKGIVIAAADFYTPWGNVVVIEHHYLENGAPKSVRSLYAHLDAVLVSKGDTVGRRQQIGTIGTGNGTYPAHLHFELRPESLFDKPVDFWPSSEGFDSNWVASNYLDPSEFVRAHRTSVCPAKLNNFVLAFKSEYRLHHFQNGALQRTYAIALGQESKGHKEREGDNRTPEGSYTIIQKSAGPFDGTMGPWFGAGWMRINYPNAFDAAAGLKNGTITQDHHDRIVAAIEAGNEPPKHTGLGGGIGIHGWNGVWKDTGYQDLTWGCISINNSDLEHFYKVVPVGTPIIIRP